MKDPTTTTTTICMDSIRMLLGLWCWTGQECQGLS